MGKSNELRTITLGERSYYSISDDFKLYVDEKDVNFINGIAAVNVTGYYNRGAKKMYIFGYNK